MLGGNRVWRNPAATAASTRDLEVQKSCNGNTSSIISDSIAVTTKKDDADRVGG